MTTSKPPTAPKMQQLPSADIYGPRLYAFLRRLERNNNREFFAENRAEYTLLRDSWLADLQRLIDLLAAARPAYGVRTARQAAYRINRDIRFSPDKSPYKPYFSALVTDGHGKHDQRAAFYIHCGPGDFNGLFGGIWCPPPPLLRKLRHAIVDNIDEWETILADPAVARDFQVFSSGQLKTVPKGWPKDHPQAHWLRRLDYGLARQEPEAFFCDPAWPEKAAALCMSLQPLNDFINYSILEE